MVIPRKNALVHSLKIYQSGYIEVQNNKKANVSRETLAFLFEIAIRLDPFCPLLNVSRETKYAPKEGPFRDKLE